MCSPVGTLRPPRRVAERRGLAVSSGRCAQTEAWLCRCVPYPAPAPPNTTTQVSDRLRPRAPVRSPRATPTPPHAGARAGSRAPPSPNLPEPRVRAHHGGLGAACSDPVAAGSGGSSRAYPAGRAPTACSSAWSARDKRCRRRRRRRAPGPGVRRGVRRHGRHDRGWAPPWPARLARLAVDLGSRSISRRSVERASDRASDL